MLRWLLTVMLGGLTVAGALSAHADEVLMVTWQGKTPSEVAFEKELKKLRPGVKITLIDAERDRKQLGRKLQKQNMSKVDLVCSFGTDSTLMLKTFLKDRTPHVFNIVSTPVLSGIVDTLEKPGGNRTGARLLMDFDVQMDVLAKLKNIKTLAVWFDPREKQNAAVLKSLKGLAANKGIKVFASRLVPGSANFDDILVKASEEANQKDALYIVGSSSYLKAGQNLYSKLDPKLLTVSSAGLLTRYGVMAAMGASFSERGRKVAQFADMILDGKPAGEIPVSKVTRKNAFLFAHRKKLEAAGVTDLEALGLNMKIKYVDAQ